VLRPELGARPRVYYKNLHLFDKAFIAGNVVFGDTDECAEGAMAVVTAAGRPAGEAVASNYGDFYVDRLEPGREYSVTVEAPGYAAFTSTVTLDKSLNLGTVTLEKL
jgi:hypothetical protein